MINNFKPAAGVGKDDPFNKARLAKEAEREQKDIKAREIQQQKSQLQMQLDNRKRELAQSTSLLEGKKRQLVEADKNLAMFEKTLATLKTEIVRQESLANSFDKKTANLSVSFDKNAEVSLKSRIRQAEQVVDELKTELSRLMTNVARKAQQSTAKALSTETAEFEINKIRGELVVKERIKTNTARDRVALGVEIKGLESEVQTKMSEMEEVKRKLLTLH